MLGLWYVGVYVGLWYVLHDMLANSNHARKVLIEGLLFVGELVLALGVVEWNVAVQSHINSLNYRFIFVGHLTANKAPDVLVKAARSLKREGIPFQIDICGEGPLHDSLRADIQAFDLTAEVKLWG